MARRLPLILVTAAIVAGVGVGVASPASAAQDEYYWASVTQKCTTTTGESLVQFVIEPSEQAIPERGEISAASYDLVGGYVVRVNGMPQIGGPFGHGGGLGSPAAQSGHLTVAGSPSRITFTVSIRWDDYRGGGPHEVTASYRLDLSPCEPKPRYEWKPHCDGGGELFVFNDPTAGGSVDIEVFGADGFYQGGYTAYAGGGVSMVVPRSAATSMTIKANGQVIASFGWAAPEGCPSRPGGQVEPPGEPVNAGTTGSSGGNGPAGAAPTRAPGGGGPGGGGPGAGGTPEGGTPGDSDSAPPSASASAGSGTNTPASATSTRTADAGAITHAAATTDSSSPALAFGGALVGSAMVLGAGAYLVVRQRRSREPGSP